MNSDDKIGFIQKIDSPILEKNREKVKYDLSDNNKEILKRYLNHMISHDYSDISISNHIVFLRLFCYAVKKEFGEITKEDIEMFVSMKKEAHTPNSLNVYKQRTREFFKWFYDVEGKGKYPKLVEWLVVPSIKPKEITKDELVSWDDVRALLLPNCDSFRDKAFITLLRETGARINEILSANIGDVKLEDDKGYIKLKNSKTRYNVKNYRELVLIDSFYYVDNWLRNHPLKSKESPLFTGKNGKRMEYHDVQRIIKRIELKIKESNPSWKKRLNPHSFRHAQASDMSKILSDAELRVFGGWTKTSPTIGRYTHISSDDVNQKRLEMLGRVEVKEKVNIQEDLKHCPRCNSLVDYNKFSFCGKCGMSLSKENEIKDNAKLELLNEKVEKLFQIFKEKEKKKIMKELEKE